MGGTQGAIGWWMVKSGLEDNMCKSTGDDNIVRVSPYRLASHLLGAFTIYAGLLWTGLSVMQRVPYELSATQVVDVLKVGSHLNRREQSVRSDDSLIRWLDLSE